LFFLLLFSLFASFFQLFSKFFFLPERQLMRKIIKILDLINFNQLLGSYIFFFCYFLEVIKDVLNMVVIFFEDFINHFRLYMIESFDGAFQHFLGNRRKVDFSKAWNLGKLKSTLKSSFLGQIMIILSEGYLFLMNSTYSWGI